LVSKSTSSRPVWATSNLTIAPFGNCTGTVSLRDSVKSIASTNTGCVNYRLSYKYCRTSSSSHPSIIVGNHSGAKSMMALRVAPLAATALACRVSIVISGQFRSRASAISLFYHSFSKPKKLLLRAAKLLPTTLKIKAEGQHNLSSHAKTAGAVCERRLPV
jgi:hypothetical protein